ncbi:sugar phosphate nucleotidyltransferase [Actinomycetota bacterium]|jgi:dTDP-glucose pyrophosphorylase|nr:sugar phosphate nucleotidyltransferase [Actinomycetota bacterium]
MSIVFDADSASVLDAMSAIDRGVAGAAFAVAADDLLVGVVTDGDIRRALLDGALMSDPVKPFIRTNAFVAKSADSRASILDLMQARAISQVPVVNDEGQLVAVHLLRELLGRIDRPNMALILAGGRGTRLLPTTSSLPKPMVLVAGRPILERLVNHISGFGISRIALSVGHLGDVITDHFGDGSQFGCEITYLWEDPEDPLGTGGPLGSLSKLFPELSAPVLVMNGDLVTQFDVAAMLTHHEQAGSVVTVGAFPYTHEVPYGVLQVGDAGHIESIVEKPLRQELVSGGIYVFNPSVLRKVPTDTFFPMTQVLTDCIDGGDKVSVWGVDEEWMDVGHPQDLAMARGLD